MFGSGLDHNHIGYKRVLVARPDRLGDVLLSLPVIEALRAQMPGTEITMLVQRFVSPVIERGVPGVSKTVIYDPKGRHFGFGGVLTLAEELRKGRYDCALALQSKFPVALALFFAGIPVRVGPLSHWYSYFLYNRGVRQRRSRVEMHEAEYNLDLAVQTGILGISRRRRVPQVEVPIDTLEQARLWLSEAGWDFSQKGVVIHPGMGGSAQNWPEESYARLAALLIDAGHPVLLTSGPGEDGLLARVRSRTLASARQPGAQSRLFAYGGAARQSLLFLGALQKLIGVVVAPSTGPLHLAGAVGARTVSFYPSIRVQSAKRWGPYVSSAKDAIVHAPERECDPKFKCKGAECTHEACLASITPERAFQSVLEQLHPRLIPEPERKTVS